MTESEAQAIACDLPQAEQERLASAYKAGLFSHVEEVREKADGYSLRFSWEAERVRELGEFLAVETSCCSFLDHSVEVPRGKEHIWLHFTGTAEAKALLKPELERLVPAEVAVSSESSERRVGRGLKFASFGLSGVGLAALVCCAAPFLGVTALAAASAWFIDATLAVVLMFGVGIVLWSYWRRSAARRKECC